MNNPNSISISKLNKQYGAKVVLSVDDLRIRRGCITGIIGPSGAGKSTLLRILNLLEPPTSGEVLYNDCSVPLANGGLMGLRRTMTMVFQKPALLDATVIDNIAFGLRARKLPKSEVDDRVAAVLQSIGMASQGRQRAKTLSGGEAQRVAFARALVLHPEILFLDEPTANLDPANVELLEGLIVQLNRDYETTVLIVTHNLFQAQRLAQETAFFYQGRLVEAGATQQIFSSPGAEQTRAFVEGKMIY